MARFAQFEEWVNFKKAEQPREFRRAAVNPEHVSMVLVRGDACYIYFNGTDAVLVTTQRLRDVLRELEGELNG